MIRRIALPLVALTVLLWTIVPALAAPPTAPDLNLSPEQQQKLSALEAASRAQAAQLIGQIRQCRDKLSDLYAAYALDTGEARRLNGELNRVQGQLLDLHLSEQQGLRAILTADQFARLQATLRHHEDGDRHPHDNAR